MAVQEFGQNEVISRANVNQRINQIKNYFPVSIANGGTGANTPSNARTALGVETRVTLYTNTTGTNSTITLSDDLSNYSCVDICFNVSREIFFVQRLYLLYMDTSYTVVTALNSSYIISNASNVVEARWNFAKIQLCNNTITWGKSGYGTFSFNSGNRGYGGDIPFKITQVFGYK